jgi:hypothetical protein
MTNDELHEHIRHHVSGRHHEELKSHVLEHVERVRRAPHEAVQAKQRPDYKTKRPLVKRV